MNKQDNPVIFNFSFYSKTKKELIEELSSKIYELKNCYIVTANPEILMQTRKNEAFRSVVQSANIIVPDGIGVVIAAKILRMKFKERITGFDLMTEFLHVANHQKLKVAFIGAKPERLDKMIKNIHKDYPFIQTFKQHGYFKEDETNLIRKNLHDFSPDIIFVALGAPKQDFFIKQLQIDLEFKIAMGVGGCFDILSGDLKRAPVFWQKVGLEWLYRILQNPKRLKRSVAIPQFIFQVLKDKFFHNKEGY